jgi:hypothetical protein
MGNLENYISRVTVPTARAKLEKLMTAIKKYNADSMHSSSGAALTPST